MNRLVQEKSPYLKHAAGQPIEWYPWCEEAFERAAKEDKPVFLSTGAIWCHWCHVMAQESFEDEVIARLLNEDFISIKLDRDERPDIDRRYQRAVSSMGNGSGWPLSVFLTPQKKPFFGGTYFPPEDRQGRPGFGKVLKAVSDFYKTRRGEIEEYADRLLAVLKGDAHSSGEIDRAVLERAESSMLSAYDPEHGGFGTAPKFPAPGAVEFLTNRYYFTREETIGHAARKTLDSMAKGGFHDQIGGGFHRYSTDEAWIVPHFEKMADDNAWLLRNYSGAYAVFGTEYFKSVAEGIIRFSLEVLADPEGGFYASQDADVTADDEGGYFTWTEGDFKGLLSEEERRVLEMHLFHDKGAMHHDESKRVLFVAMTPEDIASATGYGFEKVLEIINSGREKLLRGRKARAAPFVDKTLYTGINGMFIAAYLTAYRILGDVNVKDFALKSLERIWNGRIREDELLHSEGVKGLLDDYVYIMAAMIDAYEVEAEPVYLERAEKIAGFCIKKFWDEVSGGFLDTDEEVLGVRLKAVEDIPHPSANSVGIMQLLRLHLITGKEEYYRRAEEGLKTFSGSASDLGIHAGYYFCAMDAYFNMTKLTVGRAAESELAAAAVNLFRPYKTVVHNGEDGCVTPCLASGVCLEPICNEDILRKFLEWP
ncbi:MAG: thioredoxin domain-containing protein [Thermodesulfovibrionales bacterium]